MDNVTILLTTFLITTVIVVIIQFKLYKHRKKQKSEYPILWEQFELSLKNKSYKQTVELGNKLIYNKFVPTKHLEIIQKVALELELKNPAFKKLKLNAYDKWIHHTRGQGLGFGG